MKVSNEAKIGMMVVFVIIMLGILTIRTGDFNFSKEGYFIKIHFQNIDGISLNAPVMYNGLEVGSVKEISIVNVGDATKMELDIWLDKTAQLREGAKAYVKNMGFLGEKYVGLSSGNAGAPYLKEGSILVGDEPADLDKLLQDGQVITKNFKDISGNINERLTVNEEAIDRIVNNVDSAMKNIASISQNLDERLKKNEEHIDQIFVKLESSAVNLDQFTYDLKLNPWKLMYRTKEKRQQHIDMMQNP